MSNEVRRIAVVGGGGRMGRLASELIGRHEDLELVASIGHQDDLRGVLRDSGAEVGLDLTVAGLGCQHGLWMLEAGVRPVIGTSGVSLEENRRLDEAARSLGLGGLVVPNFSLGIWLLQRACVEAARFFPDSEILEMHAATKKDAPSGTAMDTAERMIRARAEEVASEIPIHSVRLPGLYSNQEVMFGGRGEVLRLRHETYDISCFAAGIVTSLEYAAIAVGVGRGIGVAFEACGMR